MGSSPWLRVETLKRDDPQDSSAESRVETVIEALAWLRVVEDKRRSPMIKK